MISILVYGRNDERGYGMHKRVAMSLNAMAEVLSAPTSEILFVDYNTPDHLPTLPQLMRDMLTSKARVRTRVLRVRPLIHARYAAETPLGVLEPIARNIGLRRSRPQNRWILSTNTDAIIVPTGGQSLCEIVQDLPGTHYGAPRFEIPERIWEGFNRLDPAQAIASAEKWGWRARLNETVRGEGVVQFDQPGDFQLVRRTLMFGIDGFEEDALLGWHVDHNLAHRLNLKFGAEGDLSDAVKLYHCGHARRATLTHSHDRVENDVNRIVHQVRDPDLPRQRDHWGCADDAIDEVDLVSEPNAMLLSAIEAAITPLSGQVLSANFDAASYDSFWYDAGHVATHLLDLLSTYPKETVFAYSGVRRDFLDILLRGLAALAFSRRVLVGEHTAERLAVDWRSEVEVASIDHILDQADVFLFEFGLIRDEDAPARDPDHVVSQTDQEVAGLDAVADDYRSVVDFERVRDAATQGRMVVTINAIHTRFDRVTAGTLRATPSPFTTRLRYGDVNPAGESEKARADGPGSSSAKSFASLTEISAARENFMWLISANDDDLSRKPEVAARADLIEAMLTDGRLRAPAGMSRAFVLQRLSAACMPDAQLAVVVNGSELTRQGGDRALSTLARLDDWNDPAWLAGARDVVHSGPRGAVPRNGWVWERGHLLRGLAKFVDGRNDLRALVVSEHPDALLAAITDRFDRVDFADVRDILEGDAALTRVDMFASGAYIPPDRARVVRIPPPDGLAYDAVILPHSAAFRGSVAGLASVIGALRPLLAKGGMLAIASEVAMLGSGRISRLHYAVAGAALLDVLEHSCGLKPWGGVDMSVGPRDAALVGTPDDLRDGRPVLGQRRDNDIFWPAVWFLEAIDFDAFDLHNSLKMNVANLLLGEQIEAVTLGDNVYRDAGQIVAPPRDSGGHAFFGPFLPLPAGDYRADIAISGDETQRLVAEVSCGPDILVQVDVTLEPYQIVTVSLPFTLKAAYGGLSKPCEVRVWYPGEAGIRVTSVWIGVAD